MKNVMKLAGLILGSLIMVAQGAPFEQLDLNEWSIKGTKVTATAAQLNSAGTGASATITPSLVTNLNGVVAMSNLTLKGTFSVPANAVSKDALAETLDPSIVSNANCVIYGSNLTVKAGGATVIGGSFAAQGSHAFVNGWSGVITNACLGSTNTYFYNNGVVTSVYYNGSVP